MKYIFIAAALILLSSGCVKNELGDLAETNPFAEGSSYYPLYIDDYTIDDNFCRIFVTLSVDETYLDLTGKEYNVKTYVDGAYSATMPEGNLNPVHLSMNCFTEHTLQYSLVIDGGPETKKSELFVFSF